MLKKFSLGLLTVLTLLSPLSASAEIGTIFQLSQWLTSGGYVKMASTTAGLRIPSLNCTANTNGGALTADASGNVICTNDDGGGAGSQTPWTSTIDGAGFSLTNGGTLTAARVIATSTLADSTFNRTTIANGTTTNATSTNLAVSGRLNLFGTIGTALSDFCVAITGGADLCDGNDATGGAGGSGNVATSSTETAGQVAYWTSTAGTPATLGSEAGFTYQESPTELVTMANGTVSGELRSNSLHETSAGNVGLNLDTINITAQIGSGGFFKLKDGTSAFELSIDTAALTGNHTAAFQDADGTIAYLSDITNASSTLYADNGTFSGSNRFGDDTSNIFLSSTGVNQRGTNYPQNPLLSLATNIDFIFDRPADPATSGGGISFTANNGGTGDTDGGSLNFTSGLPSGTGATGTMKVYTGSDLIFEGASSTVATSTFYSNLHVKGGLKIGDASILLQGNSTSTFSKGIELTGGCFKVAGACISSGGSGASSTLLTDSSTFSGANRFATLLVTGSSTLQNFTGVNATTSQATSTNFFSTNLWATRAVIGNATATGVIAVQGTGTSTYTGGIRALTAQFDALTAASCDLKADTSGNMYCGTDATGGAGGASASTTSNFSIYKSGSTYYAYNASTTAVTSNASFSVLLQSVVDVMDAGKGGGSIYIQAGTYHVTSTTTIQGNGTAFEAPGGAIRIWGAGVGATKIVTTGNADFLAFDSVAVPMVSDLTVYMNGTSHAFYADSSNNAVRSMWMFYFANMQITSTSSAGAVPIYLGNALRGLFTNIEFTDTAGCAYFYAEGNWNPGDFTFTRSFCELQTTSNLVAFNFASTTSGGYMNQVSFDMIESIATGVGQTFMRATPVKFSSFTNLNAEQFDTLVDGYNVTMKSDWDFNYATHRTGIANLRGCRFGNTLNGVKGLAVLNTCTFKFLESDANFAVVDDMNTDPTAPNIIRGFFGSDAGTASASTSATTLTIFRDISFYGTLDNNLAPSGLAGVFQVYGPLQTRSSKTASSSIRSDATSTFQTGVNISTGCFAIANVCIGGGGSGITAIGPTGQTTAGPTVTFATSSTAYAGLTASTTITGSGATITFTNTMAGTLGIAAGGTGLSNPGASSAQVLLQFGGAVGGVTQIGAGAQYTVLQSTSGGAGFAADALHLDQSAAVTGKLAVLNGGTGTSTAPAGQLIYGGGSSGAYQSVATTTLVAGTNISFSGGTPVIIGSTPVTINGTGGGGGGSGIGWSWNSINSLYMSTSTDDLLLGASATSSTAKFEVKANLGLLAGVFLNGAVAINATGTLHRLDVNGRIHANQERVYCRVPFFTATALTADGMGSATVAPPACTGEMWTDVNTDGTIQAIPDVPVEFASGTPFLQGVVAGNTTSGVANEFIALKTLSLGSATSSLGNGIAAEWTLNLPNISTATTSVDWFWGFSDVGLGSKTTIATYATPVNSCMLVASSTANFLLVARKASVETRTTTSISTSTVAGSNSAKFLIVMDQTGCAVYLNGSQTAAGTIAASAIPVVSNMKFNFGVGIRVGGFTTAALARMNIGDITWWGQ